MSEEEREQLYCMIGGDGKEYGPATADQIRRWIAEGRANAYTPARLAGDEGPEAWRPLGERPEFAEALRAAGEAPAPEPPPLEGAARFGGEPTVPSAPPEAPPRELTVGGALAADNRRVLGGLAHPDGSYAAFHRRARLAASGQRAPCGRRVLGDAQSPSRPGDNFRGHV